MRLIPWAMTCVGVGVVVSPWLWAAVGDDVTVYRTDGMSFQATVVRESADAVTFDVVYDTITLKRADIARMVPLHATPAVAPPMRPAMPTRQQTLPTEDVAVGLNVGNRAPPFEAQDVEGHNYSNATAAGHIVILHFWATWCPHCRHAMPTLTSVYRRYEPQGLRLLAISNEDATVLQRFAEQQEIPYPVIASPRVASRYGVNSIPTTFVIDQQGIIRYRQQGESDEFVAIVERLM